ncbi:MAG: AtpZ/AtpI family protein [Negativicutes bacterium]|nr:AtpZ/AtpI family protein [Negativicutes bacterium]
MGLVKRQDKRQMLDAFSLVGTIGISMVASVAVGLFGGRAIDGWLDSSPWATIAGIVLGMISGLWATYKRVTEVERDK